MNAVDTNVLVYACDSADPQRQARAVNLLADLPDAVLLWQVACEFIAAARKLTPCGFTAAEAWQRLGTFLRMFPLVPPTPGVLDRGRRLHLEQQLSFWDALLAAACLEAGVTRLYSEDLPGSAVAGLEVVNPFA
jgi:predicted nucleic acid-binding protein